MSSPGYQEPTNEQIWSQPPPLVPQQPLPNQAPSPIVKTPPLTPLPEKYRPAKDEPAQPADRMPFLMALLSLVFAIPLTAIASGSSGLRGMLVAWVGIIGVNLAYALSRRNGRGSN